MPILTIKEIKMENETQEQVQEVQSEAQQPAGPELTIVDLQNIRAIIDVAAGRGTFKAAEMEAVGATFNKLNKFLDAVAPQQPAATEEQPAA
jgi:hypothetical protein